jgi:glycosyltransferase domain-containing protein
MNSTHFPYRILIADGGDSQELENHLGEFSNYPNLDYEYIRYPYDATLDDYYRKLYDVLNRVETEYLLLADNDDFYSFSTIESHLDFLDKNSDFVASRGCLVSLEIFDRQFRPISSSKGHALRFLHVKAQSIDMESDLARINHLCAGMSSNDYYSNWYAITRTSVLVDIWKSLVELPIKEVIVLEILNHVMMVKAGKVRITTEPFYIRQSYTSSFGDSLVKSNDFLERCLIGNGLSEFSVAVNRFVEVDSVEKQEMILKSISLWLNEFILNMNLNRTLSQRRRVLVTLKKSRYSRATLFRIKKIVTLIEMKVKCEDNTFEKVISNYLLESKSKKIDYYE